MILGPNLTAIYKIQIILKIKIVISEIIVSLSFIILTLPKPFLNALLLHINQ